MILYDVFSTWLVHDVTLHDVSNININIYDAVIYLLRGMTDVLPLISQYVPSCPCNENKSLTGRTFVDENIDLFLKKTFKYNFMQWFL